MDLLERTKPRAMNLTELANLYGVSVRTMKNWLNPFHSNIGPKYGRFYTVKQIEIIFSLIGEP